MKEEISDTKLKDDLNKKKSEINNEERYKVAILEERIKGKDALLQEKCERHIDSITSSDKIANLFRESINANARSGVNLQNYPPSYPTYPPSYPTYPPTYPAYPPSNLTNQVCKFFSSAIGCRNGNSCRFEHQK